MLAANGKADNGLLRELLVDWFRMLTRSSLFPNRGERMIEYVRLRLGERRLKRDVHLSSADRAATEVSKFPRVRSTAETWDVSSRLRAASHGW